MKLLIDMNLSPRWIAVLASAGIESVHWSTLGKRDARDTEIISYAATTTTQLYDHRREQVNQAEIERIRF